MTGPSIFEKPTSVTTYHGHLQLHYPDRILIKRCGQPGCLVCTNAGLTRHWKPGWRRLLDAVWAILNRPVWRRRR